MTALSVRVCVCVCIQVSVEVSLRCTCSHLAGLGSCRRVGPPSLIVSCTRLSTFACANLSNNICPPSAANYGSQLAAWTLATLHFDPLGDLCSCNRPSWLATASVFAVILRRKSLMSEKKREGKKRYRGHREEGCLTESVRVFFSCRCCCCCFCATNVS